MKIPVNIHAQSTPTRERPPTRASAHLSHHAPQASRRPAGVRGCAPRAPHVRCSPLPAGVRGCAPRASCRLHCPCAGLRKRKRAMDASATDEGAHTLHARAVCHASVTHAPANAAHRPAHMCVCCTQRGSVGLWGSRRDSPRGSRNRAAIDAPRHPVLDANLLAAVFAALHAAVAIAVDAAVLAAVAAAVVTPLDANPLAAVAAALLAAVATSFDPPVFLPVHAAHGSAAAPARAARPSLVPHVSARPHSSALRTTRRDNGLIAIAGGQGVRRNAFSVEIQKCCPAR